MNDTIKCSFCGKSQEEVLKLIAGPKNVCICDGCIELCNGILAEEAPDKIHVLLGNKYLSQMAISIFIMERGLPPTATVQDLMIEYKKAAEEHAKASIEEEVIRRELRKKLLKEEIAEKQKLSKETASELDRLQRELAAL